MSITSSRAPLWQKRKQLWTAHSVFKVEAACGGTIACHHAISLLLRIPSLSSFVNKAGQVPGDPLPLATDELTYRLDDVMIRR